MYNEFFGLKEAPFSIAPDPRYLYMSERHREALAHLLYGIDSNGGFVLLTGEVGTGKTTVCRCLLEQIPKHTDISLIFNPKLNAEELLGAICDELGIAYPEGNNSIKVFIDRINVHLLSAHAKGRNTVLIIDEAQNLSTEVLEQLRLLTNLETNERKLLQIILLGQPELHDMLTKPELRQLAQRITARYYLAPLSQHEVSDYIQHRLGVAGAQDPLFYGSSLRKLYHLSGGVPRLINVLCDRALLGAYAQDQKTVDTRILSQAAKEVFGKGQYTRSESQGKLTWIILALILLSGIGVAADYYYDAIKPDLIQTKAVEATSVTKAVSPEPLRLIDQFFIADSYALAFHELFKLWDIDYEIERDGEACLFAQDQGLQCLHKQGNLRSLHLLNQPVILKLRNAQGEAWHIPLTKLQKKAATVILKGKHEIVALESIEQQWLGSYTLLWRPPPGYQGDMLPGARGADIEWLARQLDSIQGRKQSDTKKNSYDQQLLERVRAFQQSEGLIPDGIAGPQTIIRINAILGVAGPALLSDGTE